MGKLAVIKTKETNSSVEVFINNIANEEKRRDCFQLIKMMENATKEKPKIWGSSIIGFGNKRYKSPATGREVDWLKIGFSPRKSNISLSLVLDIKQYAELLTKLGKHKAGVGCLYINKLADIDNKVLEDLVALAAKSKE